MNFIFISPNFPDSYRHFCTNLRKNGVNVLGIGDAAYEELKPDLKKALTEYYKVDSMQNYDSMLRAVGFFISKYGRIDWLESNNEFWLETDARLRTDFNITSGLKTEDMYRIKRKSAMKEVYRSAGLKVARGLLVTDGVTIDDLLKFTAETGYPVVAKPDNGVGAIDTYKLCSDEDARSFMDSRPAADYLCEEFVPGAVTTYDGIANSKGEVLFAASHITSTSIMDMVNEHKPCIYYVDKEMPADIEAAGKAVLKAFNVHSRFFHLEFFRMTEDKEGLGSKGDIVALEVNMRPAGGFTTDMINFSQSADVFKIWADMVAFDEKKDTYDGPKTYCVYGGRRDEVKYRLSKEQLMAYCGTHGRLFTRMPGAGDTMGNEANIACFDTIEEMNDFIRAAFEVESENNE